MTARQWFETVPDPFLRTALLENVNTSGINHAKEFNSLLDAICGGIHWSGCTMEPPVQYYEHEMKGIYVGLNEPTNTMRYKWAKTATYISMGGQPAVIEGFHAKYYIDKIVDPVLKEELLSKFNITLKSHAKGPVFKDFIGFLRWLYNVNPFDLGGTSHPLEYKLIRSAYNNKQIEMLPDED